MTTPQLYHIYMRSLLTGESRTSKAAVTQGVGQPIVDRFNQEQRGHITYSLLPVGELPASEPVVDQQTWIELLRDLGARPPQ